jgi:hypothetical protein
LPELLRWKYHLLFSIVLEQVTGLEWAFIRQIKTIDKMPAENALIAICRALSIKRAAFKSIICLLKGVNEASAEVPDEIHYALATFDSYTSEDAANLLGEWKRRRFMRPPQPDDYEYVYLSARDANLKR